MLGLGAGRGLGVGVGFSVFVVTGDIRGCLLLGLRSVRVKVRVEAKSHWSLSRRYRLDGKETNANLYARCLCSARKPKLNPIWLEAV